MTDSFQIFSRKYVENDANIANMGRSELIMFYFIPQNASKSKFQFNSNFHAECQMNDANFHLAYLFNA